MTAIAITRTDLTSAVLLDEARGDRQGALTGVWAKHGTHPRPLRRTGELTIWLSR